MTPLQKPRTERNPEAWKTEVRMKIYSYVGKAGWEYPPGVEDSISTHWMAGSTPNVAALAICEKYWPDEMDEHRRTGSKHSTDYRVTGQQDSGPRNSEE